MAGADVVGLWSNVSGLWSRSVHSESGNVIVIGQPLIVRVSVQKSDFALGVIPDKIPFVGRLRMRARAGDDPILSTGLKLNAGLIS